MGLVYDKRPVERTLLVRRSVQWAFLLLNLWIGVRFYAWVRYFETGGVSPFVPRPAGVEGWLPIASLMNLKYLLLTGMVPDVHPAGMFLLLAFLAISWIFRKAFCSWLCPIGTLSEWLWNGGREMFGKNLGAASMVRRAASEPEVHPAGPVRVGGGEHVDGRPARVHRQPLRPGGRREDARLLPGRGPHRPSRSAPVLVILSVITKNVWCRYLCPYGALMGLVSMLSPTRITRDPISCIDCGKCAKACPSLLPVDTCCGPMRTPECSGCLTCVTACPVKDALEMRTFVTRRRVPAPAIAGGVLAIFLLVVGSAKFAGYWDGHISEQLLFELIPKAAGLSHP